MYLLLAIIVHQSLLSHSQFVCPPNKDCTISCDNDNVLFGSCSQETIDASQALSLQLYCNTNSCKDITILCPVNSTASCNIHCNGDGSCAGQYGTPIINSSFSSTLNLHCNGNEACALIYIYGPLLNASIVCSGYYSCSTYGSFGGLMQPHFYLSHTNNVKIDCNGQSSCRGNYFFVKYSNNVYIRNDGGDHSLEYSYIYGSHINNTLSIECPLGYQNCWHLNVYCPVTAVCMINNEAFINHIRLFITNDSSSNIDLIGYDYELICQNKNIHNELIYNRTTNAYRCADPDNGCCPHYFKTRTPTTSAPTTSAPTTSAPITSVPTTTTPTTTAPTTTAPTTRAPITNVPTTNFPTTRDPKVTGVTARTPTTESTVSIIVDSSTSDLSTTDKPYYSNDSHSGNSYLLMIVVFIVVIIGSVAIGIYVWHKRRKKVLMQNFVQLDNVKN